MAAVVDSTGSPFSEPVTYVSRAKASSSPNQYAFVVAGSTIFIPGYMVTGRPLQVGTVLSGLRRDATSGRMPFRATRVFDPQAGDNTENVAAASKHTANITVGKDTANMLSALADDIANGDDTVNENEQEDDEDDDDRLGPTGERRTGASQEEDEEGEGEWDEPVQEANDEEDYYEEEEEEEEPEEEDDSLPDAATAAECLRAYIEANGGEIKIVAPPKHPGTLAHFYRESPLAAEVIKNGLGFSSFVRDRFPDTFALLGQHPSYKLTLRGHVNAELGPPPSAPPSKAKAGKVKGGSALPVSQAAIAASARANGVSPAAMAANARARNATPGLVAKTANPPVASAAAAMPPRPAAMTLGMHTLDVVALREDLAGLRIDLANATLALSHAHERMRRMHLALGDGFLEPAPMISPVLNESSAA